MLGWHQKMIPVPPHFPDVNFVGRISRKVDSWRESWLLPLRPNRIEIPEDSLQNRYSWELGPHFQNPCLKKNKKSTKKWKTAWNPKKNKWTTKIEVPQKNPRAFIQMFPTSDGPNPHNNTFDARPRNLVSSLRNCLVLAFVRFPPNVRLNCRRVDGIGSVRIRSVFAGISENYQIWC